MKVYFKFSFLDYLILVVFTIGLIGFIIFPFQNKNNQGMLYMLKKDHEAAHEVFIKCLSNKQSVCRMNMALNHFFLKKYIESMKEYMIAKQYSVNKKFLFYSSFNSAISATANQDKDLALKFYQNSLFYYPDSMEVKTNIELLFREEKSQKQSQNQKDQQDQKRQNQSESGEEKEGERSTDKENRQDSKEQQGESESHDVKKQDAQKINEKQMQAILKSILEQEKQIRKKQQESQMRSPVLEKDW